MKAISLWQPWASAIALGLKQIETRSWPTFHAGEIAICAAKKQTGELADIFNQLKINHDAICMAFDKAGQLDFDTLPFGAVVAVAELVEPVRTNMITAARLSPVEAALGDYSAGRYGWILTNVRKLSKPVPCVGRQGLFNLAPSVETMVRAQL